MAYDVFWKVAVDFRKFDISVPRFNFTDRGPFDFLPVIPTPDDGDLLFQDEIPLPETAGERFADAFMGNDFLRSGQTLTEGDLQIYIDFNAVTGAIEGYIRPFILPFSITQLNSVIDSAGTKDDLGFLRLMLGGDNEIRLGGASGSRKTDNFVFGAAGNDKIYGAAGQDTLKGDGGARHDQWGKCRGKHHGGHGGRPDQGGGR